MLQHRLIALLQFSVIVITILIILHYIYIGRPRKYSQEFEDLYNKLEGEDATYARDALNAAENEPEESRDSEYYYRMGLIFQHNLHDMRSATLCYERALALLDEERKLNNNYLFITDRIADNAILANNNALLNNANTAQRAGIRFGFADLHIYATPETNANFIPSNTSKRANMIESRKTFKSDSQNVHDSAINADIMEQYSRIKRYNEAEGLNFSIESYVPPEDHRKTRINKVLDVIKSNPEKTSFTNTTEYEFINAIWNRINSVRNYKNKDDLIESFSQQLYECASSDISTVCVAGRCSHVISSLALLDRDPELGILKPRDALRNELLNDAAKVVEKYTGESTKVDKKIIEDYNNNVDSNAVSELKECMIREISQLEKKYQGKLPDDQVRLLIQQSLSVV